MTQIKHTPSANPIKPRPDFPLFAHNTGRWAKKIKGKMHYFGPWPWGALERPGWCLQAIRGVCRQGRAHRGQDRNDAPQAAVILPAKDQIAASG